MSQGKPTLSVVIPAYNEVPNLRSDVLDEVDRYLANQEYHSEVLVVDDGSHDGTPGFLRRWLRDKQSWRLLRIPHRGKAAAVKQGVLAARGRYILYTDFDQATPITEIEKLMPFMEKGYAIAIGSREVKGSRREAEPWYRHLMGRGFNLLVQLLALPGIQDTQCGFKLLEKNVAQTLFRKLRVYADRQEKRAYTGAFDVELLFLAQKRKLAIAEVPVSWKHVRTSRVHPVRDSLRMFVDLVKIRVLDALGKYD